MEVEGSREGDGVSDPEGGMGAAFSGSEHSRLVCLTVELASCQDVYRRAHQSPARSRGPHRDVRDQHGRGVPREAHRGGGQHELPGSPVHPPPPHPRWRGNRASGVENRQAVTGGLLHAVPGNSDLLSASCVRAAVVQVHRVGGDQPGGIPEVNFVLWFLGSVTIFSHGPGACLREVALLPLVGVPGSGHSPFAATGLHSALQLTEPSSHILCLFAVLLGGVSLI